MEKLLHVRVEEGGHRKNGGTGKRVNTRRDGNAGNDGDPPVRHREGNLALRSLHLHLTQGDRHLHLLNIQIIHILMLIGRRELGISGMNVKERTANDMTAPTSLTWTSQNLTANVKNLQITGTKS